MYHLKKVYHLLPKKLLAKIPILFLLLLLNSFFEILSLGSILPLLNSLLDKSFASSLFIKIDNSLVRNFLLSFDQREQILFFSGMLILIYFFKYLIYLVTLNYNLNFSKKLTIDLTRNIIFGYFKKSYQSFTKTNLSEKFTNTFVGIKYITNFYVKSFLNLMLESFIVFFVIILIIFVQPYASLVALSFFLIISYFFFKFNKKKIEYFSEIVQIEDKKRVKSFQEILTLFKEIIVFKKQNFFKNKFLESLDIFESYSKKINFLKTFPRPILEFLGTLSLIIFLMISFYFSENNLNKIIIEIAIISAAGFRLLPSVNRIMVSIVEIKSSIPYLNSILKSDLFETNINSINREIEKKKYLISKNIFFKNISFAYNKNKIINNASLLIERNDKIGIIGKSGDGKTTLLEIICGLYKPSAGFVKIDGKKTTFDNLLNLSISYVSQNNTLFEGTILENILFGDNEKKIDYQKLELILDILQLKTFISSLKKKLNTTVGEMGSKISGGQKQRLAIARSLYNDSQILILDEATNSLDIETEKKVINNINKFFADKTIIFVSHRKKSLVFCNKIFKLTNKKLKRFK